MLLVCKTSDGIEKPQSATGLPTWFDPSTVSTYKARLQCIKWCFIQTNNEAINW